ncbi:hypothetical protein BVRB_8g199470 [Beta vulgaris subsp. vulgaris]|nr:hypothetical protein BVRB_8g199470 [Beta vulgaris subsp. vulgaris]
MISPDIMKKVRAKMRSAIFRVVKRESIKLLIEIID